MNLTIDKTDLVIELSKLMALYHAQGLKAAQKFYSIPADVSASEWAKCNYADYIIEANNFVSDKLECK